MIILKILELNQGKIMKKMIFVLTLFTSALSLAKTNYYVGQNEFSNNSSSKESCLVSVEINERNKRLLKAEVSGISLNKFIQSGTGEEVVNTSKAPVDLSYFVNHPDRGNDLNKTLNFSYFSTSKIIKRKSIKHKTFFNNVKYFFSSAELFEEDIRYLQGKYEGFVKLELNSEDNLTNIHISRGEPSLYGVERQIKCINLKPVRK